MVLYDKLFKLARGNYYGKSGYPKKKAGGTAMNENAEMKKQEREQIVELGSDITKSKRGNIYTLTIIGQVEGK